MDSDSVTDRGLRLRGRFCVSVVSFRAKTFAPHSKDDCFTSAFRPEESRRIPRKKSRFSPLSLDEDENVVRDKSTHRTLETVKERTNMLQQWPVANQRTPPLNRRQSGPTAHGRCTPLRESSLRRLGTQILKAAAILGSMFVRLLGVAFYLEIRLLESLKRPHADRTNAAMKPFRARKIQFLTFRSFPSRAVVQKP